MSIEYGCSGIEAQDWHSDFYKKLVQCGNKVSDANRYRVSVLVGLGIVFNKEPDSFKVASDQYLKELDSINLLTLFGKPLAKIQESDLPSWRIRNTGTMFFLKTRALVNDPDLRALKVARVNIINNLDPENENVLSDLNSYFNDYFSDSEAVLERAMELRRRLSE